MMIYLGKISWRQIAEALALEAVWIAALLWFGAWFWRAMSRRIMVHGAECAATFRSSRATSSSMRKCASPTAATFCSPYWLPWPRPPVHGRGVPDLPSCPRIAGWSFTQILFLYGFSLLPLSLFNTISVTCITSAIPTL